MTRERGLIELDSSVNTIERPGYQFDWTCEKWSEEAVDFGRRKAEKLGITHLPGHLVDHEIPQSFIDRLLGRQSRIATVRALVPIKVALSSEALRALVGPPEECVEIKGNLLLNEGIAQVEDLTMIATVLTNQTAANAWGNTNAYIGVGDSATGEAATQTDLQAATNHFYKVMNATFPSRSSQTVSFQSDFTSAEANFAWAEWSVAAGATSASGSGFLVGTKNLNRKVASLGTKATGTWTLTGQLTLS
jgi:hypothetical protein